MRRGDCPFCRMPHTECVCDDEPGEMIPDTGNGPCLTIRQMTEEAATATVTGQSA